MGLPGDPIVVPYAPQESLLSKASLFLTHAGLNSALESLGHGIPIVVLVNLEVTDKLRIVILPSIPARACNFGAVCDSLGISPDPNGTPG
jgi:UDP-glucoronosyl and UDP-glucosyl transferase